jgi:hypothetical protein
MNMPSTSRTRLITEQDHVGVPGERREPVADRVAEPFRRVDPAEELRRGDRHHHGRRRDRDAVKISGSSPT